ncbi:GntR family transcriptional regulator [Segetibacter sp. 3557_3]|uniref:GntR family transcriptional regulator n=1 Tax=Segetibacter sp. 3557_3 TaxID=2547429 RepID=UPI0010586F01|nr:winged helix-turn-helix domain-containing protein [Segetibacter sp. 3557_3]TDH28810.1 GntR family transcriptional regulator [Segetibacter sp. 3557_3]
MITSPLYKLIYFDEFSATPKYQQLANSIIKAIESAKLQVDDVLPSINELSFQFEISRDTAEKGYKYLKKIGIIGSVPGKGYYIKSTDVDRKIKIFLLFNKLSAHKKIIYDSFVGTLGDAATIDFYIYNNDFSLFKKLLLNCKEDYQYFVIIPHFMDGTENAHRVINTIPKEKLILLDKMVPGVTGNYGAVYENFEKDIYNALEEALPQLSKYHTVNMILPEYTYHPNEIITGFKRFCQEYAFNYKIVHNINKEVIKKGEVYINLMEDDLVILIEKIMGHEWQVGKDVGVISYNETALKKIILNGITTISTDFQMIGEKAAELILNKSSEHIEARFYLTLRNSL